MSRSFYNYAPEIEEYGFYTYYKLPITLAGHVDINKYLKSDAEVVDCGDGVRYVSCIMPYVEFKLLTTGVLDSEITNKPVEVRFYVDKNGYLCELQFDTSFDFEGNGEIYTSS